MKKTRLKLKKQVWLSLIALKIGLNIYHDYQYHQTDEYKLLEKGYSLEEIKLLQNSLEPNTFKDLVNTPKNEFLLSLFKEPYYLQKNLNDYLA